MLKLVVLVVLALTVESAPTAGILGLGHAIAIPAATSHTSRVDIHSTPIVYSAPTVVAAPAYGAAIALPAVSHVARVDVTNAGHLGLALGGGLLGHPLQEALWEKAQVSTLQLKLKLEFRDLDCLTTVEEVTEAIRKTLPNCETDPKVILTKVNSRQLKMALIEINEHYALELLKTARIKVGWVNSRIRKRVEVTRCYRCFGYGHRQATCFEPDRRKEKLCMGCGEKCHLKKNCTNKPRCFLCSAENARDHIAGSGKCGVFRQALEKARAEHISGLEKKHQVNE
ncbi:hypothetical protein Trydic_g16880 [Trypoxylus dichotomus]